nr:ribonuclease H-like domain-containing protein [Tanacetum cinerariifolium]
MQRKKNDVKARTTLLLSLLDEHQLRNDLDTMSLDDLYNHLKVNEAEDINQIDKDDMEEMDIKWSMALLSMRTDKFWKRTLKKISIQGSDVVGFDKSKVECFNCHKMGHFARECIEPRSQERGRKESYRQGSKTKEKTTKALMAIDGVGWDWSYMENKGEDHALVVDGETPTKFALMANTKSKVKEGVGYNAVPLPVVDLYLSPKKDLSWTCLPEFVDDTVTDYSRPSPTIASTSAEGPEFVLNKKACYNCGDFSHLANDCRRRVQRETTRSQSHTYKRPQLRSSGHKPHGGSMRPSHRPTGHRPHGPSMNLRRPNMNCARPNRSFLIQAPSYETKPFLKSLAVKTQYTAPLVPTVNRNNPPVSRKFSTGKRNFPTVTWKFSTTSRKFTTGSIKNHTADMGRKRKAGSSQNNIDDKGYWDSGCSRHMIGNISYLSNFEPFDGGYLSFGQGGGNITGKGTIKIGKLEFENVYFVKDLKYNLFSVSQICDNKKNVLFTDTKCIVLGRNFKLLDDANILLRTPRQHNMYSIDLNNIVPHKDLTCLVAKASADKCILWHRRLGHLNVKTMNKLVRHNLVRGLPTKSFENDHTYTACLKGKQHKASCKSKSKDETSDILKKFITKIENLRDLMVKII